MSAPTGSGKTLAYLAPIVHDLQGLEPRVARGEGTYALVLVPTRELCLQVTDVLAMLLRRYHWLARALINSGCGSHMDDGAGPMVPWETALDSACSCLTLPW